MVTLVRYYTGQLKWLTTAVALANTVVVAALLAIPIGRSLHLIEQELGSAGTIGWLLFFIPSFNAALALYSARRTSGRLTRFAVAIAFLGSFLLVPVTLFSAYSGPAQTRLLGGAVGVLFALNTVVLWTDFLEVVRSAGPSTEEPPK